MFSSKIVLSSITKNIGTRHSFRSYGGLKDKDRIFTNLYGEQDFGLQGALKRVCVKVHKVSSHTE